MKTLLISLVMSASTAMAGGSVGTMDAAKATVGLDYVYSIGSQGQLEKIAVGTWKDRKWTVKVHDIAISDEMNPALEKAISGSKATRNWAALGGQ